MRMLIIRTNVSPIVDFGLNAHTYHVLHEILIREYCGALIFVFFLRSLLLLKVESQRKLKFWTYFAPGCPETNSLMVKLQECISRFVALHTSVILNFPHGKPLNMIFLKFQRCFFSLQIFCGIFRPWCWFSLLLNNKIVSEILKHPNQVTHFCNFTVHLLKIFYAHLYTLHQMNFWFLALVNYCLHIDGETSKPYISIAMFQNLCFFFS